MGRGLTCYFFLKERTIAITTSTSTTTTIIISVLTVDAKLATAVFNESIELAKLEMSPLNCCDRLDMAFRTN